MKQTCVTRLFVSMLFVWLVGFVLGSDLSFFFNLEDRCCLTNSKHTSQVRLKRSEDWGKQQKKRSTFKKKTDCRDLFGTGCLEE